MVHRLGTSNFKEYCPSQKGDVSRIAKIPEVDGEQL